MENRSSKDNYTIKYNLNDRETKMLINILLKQKGFYYGTLFVLIIKEVKGDVLSALRIASGISREESLVRGKGFYTEFIRAIKTAIVLTERSEGKEPLEMEKMLRFEDLGIDRNFIYRVRKRYKKLWNMLYKEEVQDVYN